MECCAESMESAQIIFSLLIMGPIFYWAIMKARKIKSPERDKNGVTNREICVVLPMRNEGANVERKISSIIEEILPYSFVSMIVADSDSDDRTKQIAREFLDKSPLEESRWRIMSFDVRGKNIALNGVMEEITADIVVISDADAKVAPGWLEIVSSRMDEEDIGVVSGIERENPQHTSGFNDYYRGKSNWLRVSESEIDSTPVLEGSILAWKTSALGKFRLNERMNADDAQIGFFSIRSGHRSIIDQRLTFRRFEGSPDRTFMESVRRAQGLSLALLKNADLAISGPRKESRVAIFNALYLYVFFPWAAVFFVLNSLIYFSFNPGLDYSIRSVSVVVILLILISRQGRFVAKGISISILAHIQAVSGRRYQNWDPIR